MSAIEDSTTTRAVGPDATQQYQLSLMERILQKVGEAHRLCISQSPGDVLGLVDDAGAYFRELHCTIPQQPYVRPTIQLRLALPAPAREEPLPIWVADRRPI